MIIILDLVRSDVENMLTLAVSHYCFQNVLMVYRLVHMCVSACVRVCVSSLDSGDGKALLHL